MQGFAISCLRAAAAVAICGTLAGCASGGGGTAFTGSADGSCEALRKEMNALVNRGGIAQVEAWQAGRKLTPQASAQVDRYNAVLEGYLGQECQNR